MSDKYQVTETADIKILICYLLSSCPSPLDRGTVCNTLSAGDTVNYFDAAAAVSDLIRDGFVAEDEEGCRVTEKGAQIASSFGRKLPAAVREKTAASALRLSASLRSQSENPCETEPVSGGGYRVTMCIRDGGEELMKISLLTADREQAESLAKRFRSDPMLAYTGVIALLTGDVNSVGGRLISSPLDD